MRHVGLPDSVTVAQQTLNLFVMVQIHVGQPFPIYDFRFLTYELHQLRSLSAQHTLHFRVFRINLDDPVSTALGNWILRAVVDPPKRAALEVL